MTSTKFRIYKTGYCTQYEKNVIKGGGNTKRKFYAPFVLIQHQKVGNILFDTGYSREFYNATKSFPYNIYAKTTPVYLSDGCSAVEIIKELGIKPHQINYIIISHFHADHISGLKDFPQAKFICSRRAVDSIRGKRGFKALLRGFLPKLLPHNFYQRLIYTQELKVVALNEKYAPFKTGVDIFGDGSITAVELPGHSLGQIGIIIKDVDCKDYFFIADACWLSDSYKRFAPPPNIAYIIMSNKKDYLNTLFMIQSLYLSNKEINIIPSHCNEALDTY